MKTDELLSLLAKDAVPVAPHAAARRFAAGLKWGLPVTALAMALLLGVRPDIGEAVRLPMFWIKLGFPLLVALAALQAATRVSRPGVRLGWAPVGMLTALFAGIGLLAAAALLQAAPAARSALIFGDTWLFCLVSIPLLSLPAFIASLWAMKGLAPTRPGLAGAAAGLLAGAVSAAVYSLHCPEMGAPFLATWYVLGMLIPTLAGACVGPRLLRW